MAQKYYVVWAGHDTGVFDNWEDAQLQVEGFPGARFKAFTSREAAVEAYRNAERADTLAIIGAIAAHPADTVNYAALPGVNTNAIAVDASCPGNPGPVEYRGIDLRTSRQMFAVGPIPAGTNNIGEFLAIVHALALIDRDNLQGMSVYTDSRTALTWLRRGFANTKITPSPANAQIRGILARAQTWLQNHPRHAPVLKWDTDNWGEVPADYGRK